MTEAAVLVGIDGSDASLYALDRAVVEARLRGCPVRAIYADPWANHPAWANQPPDPQSEPQLTIQAAAQRTRAADVPVATEILTGDAAPVLIRESANVALLVVGHRGRGGFPELLLGSVATKVAAHAHSPVIVTRGTPGAPSGDIVVGVDGTTANQTALEFAFTEAALHATRIHAVHAWTGPELTGPSDLIIDDPVADRRGQQSLIHDAIAPWTQRYPAMPVRYTILRGRPAHALIDASHHAQLLVVGPHTPGLLPGIRLGTITHTVLHHAACPVAVAR